MNPDSTQRRRPTSLSGYILLEASVGLVVLSIGVFVVQGTLRDALRTRGQAQDFTQASLLLNQIVADLEAERELIEHAKDGQFPGQLDRFSWRYEVRRVDVPVPPAPPPPEGVTVVEKKPPAEWLAHVIVTVNWERSGIPFERSVETLLRTERLWQPE